MNVSRLFIYQIHIYPQYHYNIIQTHNLKQSVTFANQSKLKINALIATGDFISNSSRKDAILFMESFYENIFTKGIISRLLYAQAITTAI